MLKFNDGFKYYNDDPENHEMVFFFWWVTFFIMVIMFGFIIGSLFVASVVTNLDKAMLEQNEDEKRDEQGEDFLSGVFETADYDEQDREDIKRDIREREIKMEYLTDFSMFASTRHKVEKQVFHKCSNGKRTSERVEDKLLLLGEYFYGSLKFFKNHSSEALDRNLKEYVVYRDQLIEIIEEIKVLFVSKLFFVIFIIHFIALERSEYNK